MRLRCIALSVAGLVVIGVVGAVAPASAGGFCRGGITTGKGTDVIIKGNCFEPRVLYVEPGAKVGFTNLDPAPHTVTAPGNWGTYHEELAKDDTVRFAFKQEGVYPYVCLLHPGMVGAIVVGDGKTGKMGAANVGFVPPDQMPPPPDAAAAAPAAATVDDEGSESVLAFALALAVVLLIAAIGALVAGRRRAADDMTAAEPGAPTI